MSDLQQVLDQINRLHEHSTNRDKKIDGLVDGVHTLTTEFKLHASNEEAIMGKSIADMVEIRKGFPKDPNTDEHDPSYHRRLHETEIEDIKASKDFRQKIMIGITIAALTFLGGSVTALLISGAKVEVSRAAIVEKVK